MFCLAVLTGHFCCCLLLSLKVRQDQWKQEEAERIANMPDPSVPAGHALMPRDEQRQTLANLQTSK